MLTVIFYDLILITSTVLVWLSEKTSYRYTRLLFIGAAFCILFFPSALRYDIGTDYLNYIKIYSNLERYDFKEPGFYFINMVLKSVNADPQWVIVVFSFIFTFSLFKLHGYKNYWVLFFCVVSVLWFESLNHIRQVLALLLCLIATFKFFEKSNISCIVFFSLGILFHKSALFLLIICLFSLIPLNRFVKVRVAPCVFVVIVLISPFFVPYLIQLIERMLLMLGFDRYATYFYNEKYFRIRDYGTGLGILVNLLFSIYILLNSRFIIRENERYWFVIIVVFLYALSLVIAREITIFSRMASLFSIGPIVSAFIIFSISKRKKVNFCVVCLFMLFLFMSFTKHGFGTKTIYADPKTNPYKTILNVNL